ncbi:DUF4097 family beta strand repeat-containing protein [Streptomyces sp. bgisy154]|uniref:DUF4097 family beta strand repeat-containing protein n=1 Tax=Streptomyces sp. bgisy154 TaxID=3413794 RepID=UPI003D734D2A
MSEWSVAEPTRLSFDEPVRDLQVRVVNGTVNVVGAEEGSARLEVSRIEGPPLVVTHRDGILTVAYEDLPWKGFLKWLDRKGWRRSAVVSLAVPVDTRVEVGVVGAAAMVSGLAGRTEVKGVTGDTTLVGLSGPVRADTVSGSVEAQALTGDLRYNSVSGDLTVVEAGSSVRAESVSGSMIVDLDPTSGPTDIALTSVSGEIAIRLPHPADARVEANTASGAVSNAFEDLRVAGQWGAKRITGRLGAGSGRLKATTVSGSIALLRRPQTEDEPGEAGPRDDGPPHDDPREAGPRDDGPREAGQREAGPRDDGPWDDESRGDRPQGDRPQGDAPQGGRPQEDRPRQAGPARPADGTAPGSGENAAAGRDEASSADPTDTPADGTTDKKVL